MGHSPEFPCLAAARAFDPRRFHRFRIGDAAVGWIHRDHVEHLRAWPGLFRFDDHGVALAGLLKEESGRTTALAGVIERLAAEGVIGGWRDERFAVAEGIHQPPLAFIERAAARFFGIPTHAAHLNGVVRRHDGWRMWIARRSPGKPVDPGMLDNLVGGGIGHGYSLRDTLVKEGWEEAGISAGIVERATPGRHIRVLREVPEGVQNETVYAHDLVLPPDFAPRNHDGEVAEFRLCPLTEVVALISAGEMTVDASLVALDFLYRQGIIPEPDDPEIRAMFRVP